MKKTYLIVAMAVLVILVVGLTILNNHKTNNSSTNTDNTITTAKIYSSRDLFTERDLAQTVDIETAMNYEVSDGNDIKITDEGIYVVSGTAQNVTIYIEAEDTDKVQIVLDGVSITNETMPCIYVKTADKVFITSTGNNTLKVTGNLVLDGSTNLTGVIFSKQDITLNGTGTLNITSTENGIVGKDDLKITGGTYNITSYDVAIKANDSIRIADGTITINAETDGLHAENNDDDSLGYIYIGGGQIKINAGDDCIHGQSVVQIDDGTLNLNGVEGIEGTYIQINGGTIIINATDDGINAGSKSKKYEVTIEITGGTITIVMASGDTDGIDSNGNIIISGGTINVTGGSSFDYNGKATYTGGTIIINGVQVNSIPNQMTGGKGVRK